MNDAREPGTYFELDAAWADPGWTRVPNSIARCSTVSRRVKGWILEVASHTPSRRLTFTDMLKLSTDGRDATYSTIKEAIDAGFVTRRQERDVNGRLGVVVYRIHVAPRNARSEPLTDSPDPVEPTTGKPETSKKTNKPEDLTPSISSNEEMISLRARAHTRVGAPAREGTKPDHDGGQSALDGMPAPVSSRPVVPINRKAEETFPGFWSVYPLKKAKGAAWTAWCKAIRKADPDVIIAGVGRYVVELQRSGSYTAHPATWLNQERWTDEPTVTGGNAARGGTDRRGSGHQPYRDTEDESVFAQSIN